MKIVIIFCLLASNLVLCQDFDKFQTDKYVQQFKLKNYDEIHEGYKDNTPFSFLISRDENKKILSIRESLGKNRIIRNEYYYFNNKLIYIRHYIYNRKKNVEKNNCIIYPTLNLNNPEKCKSKDLISNGYWMLINN